MSTRIAYLKLHTSVFLFGFTAILGSLITLSSVVLVWYRLLFAVGVYFIWLVVTKELKKISLKELAEMGFVGVILGLHWITFYGSIKLASATVALVCLSCAAFCAAILEPLIYKTPLDKRNLLLGIVVIVGIYLVFTFEPAGHEWGIIVGLTSAVLSASVGVLNKRIIDRYSGALINFYELLVCFAVFTLVAPLYFYLAPVKDNIAPTNTDWLYLLILSIVCTNFAYNWSMEALRSISAFNFTIAINLEPLYGIALAFLILHEDRDVNVGFVAGIVLVLGSVFTNVWLTYRDKRNNKTAIP